MNINPKQMKFSIRKISMLVAIATLPVSLRAQEIPIYRDASKPIEERIDDALSRMTLEEKVGFMYGVPRSRMSCCNMESRDGTSFRKKPW